MEKLWKDMCAAALLGLVVPGVVLGAVSSLLAEPTEPTEPAPEPTVLPTQVTATEPEIPVLIQDGVVEEMPLGEYLTGVLLAELPAGFEQEAKKAQAVVARTYTIRAWEGKGKHENAAVCTDSGCCQAYRSPAEYISLGGDPAAVESARAAVEATAGQVLTYEGALIEATYFSCSGGSTEDAVAVWGTEVPYLQATSSPGEEGATWFRDTVTFTPAEFADALGLDLTGEPESWFGRTTYTEGGGVDTMEIGGEEFQGTALRKRLGLRSTAFSVEVSGDAITITTRGFGHRVGMSQYGANAMAEQGSGYGEILAHYYEGTQLEQRDD